MKKLEQGMLYQDLGIHVTLRQSDDNKYHYYLSSLERPYQVSLRISLPVTQTQTRVNAIRQIIKKVQTGATWPVRCDYENLTRFISLDELEQVESGLPGATFYVYGCPELKQFHGFDEETLHQWFKISRRVSQRASRTCSPVAVETSLDGQLSLFDSAN